MDPLTALNIGSTAINIGSSLFGMLKGSGGGGGVDINKIKETLNSGLSQVSGAVATGRKNTNKAVANMDRKIAQAGNEYRAASDKESKDFWNNLGLFNDELINSAEALTQAYDGDVMKALESLQTAMQGLNDDYEADMGEEISRYSSLDAAINDKLAQDSEVAKTDYLDRVRKAETDYSAATTAEIDAAKAEQMSLGDTFLQKSNEAMGKFESFLSTENTASTLDDLSKKIQQTRLDMLATADPRAAELSAIADENAAALMSGRISADVQANLARSGAMRALQGGFGAGSGMGRNLQARDLGLTSLDLMGKGYDMFDRQRRLNYDTKVSGIQDTAANVFGQMRAGQQGLMETAIGTAESDRNQRVGTVQDSSTQRLQTYDKLFASGMGTADALRQQDLTLAEKTSNNARDTNLRESGMRIGVKQDVFNNNLGLADTIFNTTTGLAGQKFSTGLSLAGDIYKTNTSGAATVYSNRLGVEGNIFGAKSQSAVSGMNAITDYEKAGLAAMSNIIGDTTATAANLPLVNASMAAGAAKNSAQTWGSVFQTGASLAGSFLGNQNWSGLGQGRTGFGGKTLNSDFGRYAQQFMP